MPEYEHTFVLLPLIGDCIWTFADLSEKSHFAEAFMRVRIEFMAFQCDPFF